MPSELSPPALCEGCGAELVSHLFCFACTTLQHFPTSLDYFGAMGLPISFALDREKLEEHFEKLTEELHPDIFAISSKELQRLSEKASTLLNQAYETLLNPFARAEYLLKQKKSNLEWNEQILPPNFLHEIFGIQEELDKLLEQQNSSGLKRISDDFKQRRSDLESKLLPAFMLLESVEEPAKVLEQLQMNLNAERYLKRLLDRCVEGKS